MSYPICILGCFRFPTGSRVAAPYLILAGTLVIKLGRVLPVPATLCHPVRRRVRRSLGTTKKRTRGSLTAICAVQAICDTHANVHLLNKRSWTYTSNILWVRRCSLHPKREGHLMQVFISDYRRIDGFRDAYEQRAARVDVKWIDATHTSSGRRLVVVTLRAPYLGHQSCKAHRQTQLCVCD
jgi:hypothetical protein